MSLLEWLAALLALVLLVYLFVALLDPEVFE
ncbi:MAG: potassium-transporting ATPase subunit F [Planctomycetes bacterium]|nr:potassium-transporting ATPase subunit F [Planctomycetota bacterium]